MIAVIASLLDDEAAALAGRWAGRGGVLLTPPDLSRAGWRLGGGGAVCGAGLGGLAGQFGAVRSADLAGSTDLAGSVGSAGVTGLDGSSCPVDPVDSVGDDHADAEAGDGICVIGPGGDTFVAEGRRHRVADLTGVLVRLPVVPSREMIGVVPEDRDYAANESTAMLSWWLSALPCPVVNTPTPACLTGPNRSRHEWLARAARLGLRTVPHAVRGSNCGRGPMPTLDAPTRLVTVVEGRAVSGPEAGHHAAELLAADAEARLLGVTFQERAGGRWALHSVTSVPPLSEEAVRVLEEVLS